VKRTIIRIDESKCTGCGMCMTNCPEGALQIIDGKARLISDLFCDGLGACIGHCPEGAIITEEREADPYDENKVMENIAKQGNNVILAHLEHLKEHKQTRYYNEAIEYLRRHKIPQPQVPDHTAKQRCGCPGGMAQTIRRNDSEADECASDRQSRLTHWPVQLKLMSPAAPAYQGADVVLSADCAAYAYADFHRDFLAGKALAIACPKLDEALTSYVEKLTALIDEAKINSLTVLTMEVPCCRGLLAMAQQAKRSAKRKIPVTSVVIAIDGTKLGGE
jgi:ferredoxin